jgi:hypothetical protein
MRQARFLLAAALLAGVTLVSGVALVSGAGLPAALAAPAAGAASRSAAGAGVSVTITSVNPAYATTGHKVTIRGTISNSTPTAVLGVTVQILSSDVPFEYRTQLQQFADGDDPQAAVAEPGAAATIRGPLQPGTTRRWRAVLPASAVRMSSFGVYPLAAQATDAVGTTLGTSWTFLPYWPSAKSARPVADDIAWIWPLIDAPDQGPCPGLLNNDLATSLSPGGRLAGLLQAGTSAAGRAARVTLAIDPALLSSAQLVAGGASYRKSPVAYQVDANQSCQDSRSYPARASAAAWLNQLKSAVVSQPAFVTPYADVDIAALIRSNLEGDLQQAFTEGRSVAAQVLGGAFARSTAGSGAASASTLIGATAWPAGGLANYSMLENLAGLNGVQAMVLSTSAMPPTQPQTYTPSAVTSTPNGERGDMRVLLADSTLTAVLGQATSASGSAGASFAVAQRFLAETAMISAQAPHLSRAIVVAPPRRWDPPAGLASELLSETAGAPWLSPVSAGRLAADQHATGQVSRQPPTNAGRDLLSPSLLHTVRGADRGVRLVQSLQATPSPQLYWAVADVESSDWRGGAAAEQPAWALLRRVTDYVAKQVHGVSIVGPGRDTLGGQSGGIPVSIDNRNPYPVKVIIHWHVTQTINGGFAVLTKSPVVVPVPANEIVTKRIKVRASAIGSTTLSLQLLAPDGQALGRGVTMSVQATHFGTFALVILAAALGVFMITSAARAVRHGREPAAPERNDEPTDRDGRASDDAPTGTGADGYEQPKAPDDAGPGLPESQQAGTGPPLTEDADDYARVPGWADRS